MQLLFMRYGKVFLYKNYFFKNHILFIFEVTINCSILCKIYVKNLHYIGSVIK